MKIAPVLVLCYLVYFFVFSNEKNSISDIIIVLSGSFVALFLSWNFKATKFFYSVGQNTKLLVKKNLSQYLVIIDKTYITQQRNQNSQFEAEKIIVIEGKIENTNHEIISLTNNNFFVYDKSGNRLTFCPLSGAQEEPIQIPMGRSETFLYAYALNDESNNIEIEYFPDTTWKKPAGIWKITVTP